MADVTIACGIFNHNLKKMNNLLKNIFNQNFFLSITRCFSRPHLNYRWLCSGPRPQGWKTLHYRAQNVVFFCTHPFSGHSTVNCDQVWVSPKPTNGSWGGGLNSIWKRLGIKPVRQATALNTLNKVMIINYLGGLLFALRYHQSFWRGVWLSYPTFSLVHLSSSVTFDLC